jgi:hypothetical protein
LTKYNHRLRISTKYRAGGRDRIKEGEGGLFGKN